MNRGGFLLSFFFFGSLSLVACSSSRESSGIGGACANYVAALRDSAKECGRFNVAPARESEYIGRVEQSCQNALNAPGSGITPAILDQCTAKVRELCGDDDACEDVIEAVRGTLAEGAACDDDYQCASGQCQTGEDPAKPSCGKCAPPVAIGQPCPRGGCVAGASCRTSSSGSSSTPVCVAVVTANEGEPCGSTQPGDQAIECATGLFCQSGGSGEATCKKLLAEGASCGDPTTGANVGRCAPPFSCVNGQCGKLLAAGSACKQSNDCQSGLGCDATTNQCAAIVWGGSGAECDGNLRRCERGFCKSVSSGSDVPPTGSCIDYLQDGERCDLQDTDRHCDSLSRCINGTCQLQNPAQCQ